MLWGMCGPNKGVKEHEYYAPVLRSVMVLYSWRNDGIVHGSSSREISSSSASEEIARMLVNPKVHHRVRKSTLSFPVVSQCNYVLSLE